MSGFYHIRLLNPIPSLESLSDPNLADESPPNQNRKSTTYEVTLANCPMLLKFMEKLALDWDLALHFQTQACLF